MNTKGLLVGLGALIIVLVIGVVVYKQPLQPGSGQVATTTATTTADGSSVEDQAHAVLLALKNQDGRALSTLAHPTKGVRFSPYGYISTSTDIVILSGGLSDIYSQAKKETWGSYDGSGKPITLSFMEYSKKFLYDVDFLSAPDVATNKILGQGNTIINIDKVYPGDTFVEYHFSGFDKKYEGMDWKSLRLIFEKEGNTWYLVGISHDQWTI